MSLTIYGEKYIRLKIAHPEQNEHSQNEDEMRIFEKRKYLAELEHLSVFNIYIKTTTFVTSRSLPLVKGLTLAGLLAR